MGKTILIADDDRSFSRVLTAFLKAKGYTVTLAYDATQALASVLRTPPDGIILDVAMPGGSGLHALQRLKASTRTNKIPVIVASAGADASLARKAKDLGADDFMPKPLDLERLQKTLSGLLGEPMDPVSQEAGPPPAHDPLARLPSQEAVVEVLRIELARSGRHAACLSVALMALDGYLFIREVYGHRAVEALLGEIARIIQSSVRPYDTIGRHGEDGLVLVLPECDCLEAVRLAERFQSRLPSKGPKAQEGAIPMMVSMGIAGWEPGKEVDAGALLSAATKALKRARSRGPSQVEFARPEDLLG